VNGNERQLDVETGELLVNVIRDRLGLTGTKESCGLGVCGACTVLLDGQPVSSCCLFAFQADGREILTIEGLSLDGRLHPLQDAFIECGGFQCGFCTPGMLLTAKVLLEEHAHPTAAEIKDYMNGNICRCTGYQMIVESIALAAEREKRSSS
jgi:carbon-monoxide dehydrogenase small subunit